MEYYTLLYYPKFTDDKITKFREKHDKHSNQWKAHLTLIFPINSKEIEEEVLIEHVGSILKKWKKFDIHFKGLEKSWDHWLFLTLKEGNEKIIKLHDELYTGPLKRFLREDIEFIPHIGIGEFVKSEEYTVVDPKEFEIDKEKFDEANKDTMRINFDYWSKIDKIILEKFEDSLNYGSIVKEFDLSP
ncbi:MAG: 2'-5' RNA ligase family protein [Patescibacteria group bacterium]|nr:2'-5' RNA ligase family protein [Patescibacteria group bacterium]